VEIASYCIAATTICFLAWERILPGRSLPRSTGWYMRSISINLIQLLITLTVGYFWHIWWRGESLLALATISSPLREGFLGWFVGTFVFYWWHRLRHVHGFWQVFHQIHHSASRIEVLTSFYKHPVEIFTNSLLTAFILFPVLGVSVTAGVWYNFFAATGEYFYHANVKTPKWLRYFVQTPELHSIHHQYDVHSFNFGDIPIWDRIFGTYRDSVTFMERCGFPDGAEQKLGKMLMFSDVYQEDPV
jgi:sterol desaturase/sphingolipid hydroxylase (fatty acid hydroxylase superfamily)